jgi:hypothetical protein
MYKTLLACALVAGLSSCAQTTPRAQAPAVTIDADGYAHAACPPGMKEYCLRREYQAQSSAARVSYLRQSLAVDQESYNKHPDPQHAATLEASKARLAAAIQQQEAGY